METLVVKMKALADLNRLRIVRQLLKQDDSLCVCQILSSLDISGGTLSRHLHVLEEAGLITGRKEGRWRHYAVAAEQREFLERVMRGVADEEAEESCGCAAASGSV